MVLFFPTGFNGFPQLLPMNPNFCSKICLPSQNVGLYKVEVFYSLMFTLPVYFCRNLLVYHTSKVN